MASQRIVAEFSSPLDEPIGVCPFISGVQREWIFNDFGSASFFLAGGTPNLARYLVDGNIVRLHEEGVPSWVGMADEQTWRNGSVHLKLKSAEWLLSGKVSQQGMVFASGQDTTGQIAHALFQSAAVHSSRIDNLRPGVFDASTRHFRRYDYVDLYDAYTDLSSVDGSAFWVDADLKVHFRDQRGRDWSGDNNPVVLYENLQLVDVTVTRRISSMYTAILGLSNGKDLASKYKYAAAKAHPTIFRGKVVNYNVNTLSQLYGPVESQLSQEVEPEFAVDCTMLRYNARVDSRPQFSEWGRFWVGDIIRMVLYSMATPLDVRVKVLGIGMDESDKIRLVVRPVDYLQTPYPLIGWGFA